MRPEREVEPSASKRYQYAVPGARPVTSTWTVWSLAAEAQKFGSPLDLSLVVYNAEGKELARNDDVPGTTDAALLFKLPADGTYDIVLTDSSGQSGSPTAIYRLLRARLRPTSPCKRSNSRMCRWGAKQRWPSRRFAATALRSRSC